MRIKCAAGNEARSFKHFLASWREFFGQTYKTASALNKARTEGKLTGDWDAHLNDLLGLREGSAGTPTDLAQSGVSTSPVPTYSLGRVPSNLRYLDSTNKSANLPHEQPPANATRDPAALFRALTGNDPGGIHGSAGADANLSRKSGGKLLSYSDLVAWASANAREIDPSSFRDVEHASFGGEHAVYLDSNSGRVIKLTKPEWFGYHAEDAGAYLQRWALSNRLFGDSAAIEGTVTLPGEDQSRLVISQPWIHGRDPTHAEIADYLMGKGFVPHEGNWVQPVLGVTVRDVYGEGNAKVSDDGTLHPIDWIAEPTGKADLRAVRNTSGIGGETTFSLQPQKSSPYPTSSELPPNAEFESRVQFLINAGTKREHAENAVRSEDLANNYEWIPGKGSLSRDKGLTLNKEIVGGIPVGWKGHHIVPLVIAQNSLFFQRAAELGYNINRGSNGIALPYDEAMSYEQNLPIHTGGHSDTYFNQVRETVRTYDNMIESDELSDEMVKLYAGKIEHCIRLQIIKGKLHLQSKGWPN